MSSAAYAEGGYLSFGGGLSMPQSSSVDIRRPPTGAAVNAKTTFDKGYIFSGAAGYAWSGGTRTELELNYRSSGLKNMAGAGTSGHQRVLGVMGNLLFDFGASGDSIRPYIGGGVGVGWNKWSNVQGGASTTFPVGTPLFNDRNATFQWQGIAGLSHPFSDSVDGFLEYRYIGTLNDKFRSVPAGSTASRHSDRSHNLLVGVRFNFNKPAEITTAAAAPPPPPPVPQKFLVFFDFDRANIRADAQQIVSEAADYAKKNGKAVIRATGHADTSGSDAYNLALSERRAVAVKAALVKLGFKPAEIVVMFRGEAEPLVATGDGVKEPQNRRVEIVME